MTKLLKCNCENEFQDEIYGKNVRLFNEKLANGKNNGWRCATCKREIRL